MKNKLVFMFLLIITITAAHNNLPRVFTLDAQKVFELRNSFLKGDLKNNPAVKKLIHNAESYLKMKPLSVTDKEQIPPSGSKHDFTSLAPYWWPDSNKTDGLPYVRKDGEKNPEVYKFVDDSNQVKMIERVRVLSLAYYITSESKYSYKATELLRIWFLDDETRMNPNLDYAQFIPGINNGRGAGIIDVHNYYQLIDAIGLLANSKEWTNDYNAKIKKWFENFLNWMQTSKNGIDESKSTNNHGSWYNVQVISISMFLGKTDLAKKYLEAVRSERIPSQFKQDGSQPFELVRTKSWHYSVFNLEACFHLASLGDHFGFNLWNYTTPEGGSFKKALDFVLPSVADNSLWKHQQISPISKNEIYQLLVLAKEKIDKNVYTEWITKLFGKKTSIDLGNLL